MRKKIIAVVAALLCSVSLSGTCFAAKVNIRVNASNNPKSAPDTAQMHWYLAFRDAMAKYSDIISCKVYFDNQLARTYADAINALQNNTIQLMNIPVSTMAEYSKAMVPLNGLFTVPYPHKEIARKAFKGELGKTICDKIVKDTGLLPISFWDFGFRHFLTKNKPIAVVKDLEGMKFRVQPNPVQLVAFKAFGANPTPIVWAELFTSLQQGVIVGTENPLVNMYQARLYEVTKYLTLSGHILEYNLVLVNAKWYKDLPANVREAFDKCVEIADKAYYDQFDKAEEGFLKLAKEKMTVSELSPESQAEFMKIGRAASKAEIVKQVGEEYYNYFMKKLEEAAQ